METIGHAPGILAVLFHRPFEDPLGWLDGGLRVPGEEMGCRQLSTDVQGPPPEPTRIGELDTIEGFGDSKGEVPFMPGEFGGELITSQGDYNITTPGRVLARGC